MAQDFGKPQPSTEAAPITEEPPHVEAQQIEDASYQLYYGQPLDRFYSFNGYGRRYGSNYGANGYGYPAYGYGYPAYGYY